MKARGFAEKEDLRRVERAIAELEGGRFRLRHSSLLKALYDKRMELAALDGRVAAAAKPLPGGS